MSEQKNIQEAVGNNSTIYEVSLDSETKQSGTFPSTEFSAENENMKECHEASGELKSESSTFVSESKCSGAQTTAEEKKITMKDGIPYMIYLTFQSVH